MRAGERGGGGVGGGGWGGKSSRSGEGEGEKDRLRKWRISLTPESVLFFGIRLNNLYTVRRVLLEQLVMVLSVLSATWTAEGCGYSPVHKGVPTPW